MVPGRVSSPRWDKTPLAPASPQRENTRPAAGKVKSKARRRTIGLPPSSSRCSASTADQDAKRAAARPLWHGESWVLAPRNLGLTEAHGGEPGRAALVSIKIEKPPGAPERRLIKVQADFPPDPPHRARHSAQMLVELGSLKTGGSR